MDDNDDHRCGLGSFSPKWLQKLNSIKLFTFCVAVISLVQSVLVNGAILSGIQSIEKEFGFSSKQSGSIVAVNDLSALVLVAVVSYFGSKKHRPRWIGRGVMVTGFGALVFALPKVLAGKYMPAAGGSFGYHLCDSNQTVVPDCSRSSGGNWVDLSIFIVAQILMGAGTAPLYTLGQAYIDDNVAPSLSPLYFGAWFSTTMLGPGLGFIVGGAFLKIFTNIYVPFDSGLEPKDPRWIGAWWLPFVTLSLPLISLGLLITCFPYEMPNGKQKKLEAIAQGHLPGEDRQVEYSVRGLLISAVKLLRNRTFICAVLAFSAGMLYLVSLGSFFAKLLSLKFGLSDYKSGLFIGVVMVPAMVVGTLSGSLLMRTIPVKGSAGKASRLCFVISLFTLASIFLFAIPGCENTKMAGVNVPYFNQSAPLSIFSSCNENCSCSRSQFVPVCGSDGVTYYNPCFAGCEFEGPADNSKQTFYRCQCVVKRLNATANLTKISNVVSRSSYKVDENTALLGKCNRNCKNVAIFLVFLGGMVLVGTMTGTPYNMIIVRAVPDNQRSFALGLSYTVMRFVSFLPGPIVLGAVLDSQCVTWGYDKCGARTSCQDYDINMLSWNIVIYGGATLVPCVILFFLAWRLYRPLPEEQVSSQLLNTNSEFEPVF